MDHTNGYKGTDSDRDGDEANSSADDGGGISRHGRRGAGEWREIKREDVEDGIKNLIGSELVDQTSSMVVGFFG